MSFAMTNYDVVLTRDTNGHCTVLTGDEIGNKRFSVLLNIHKGAYDLARMVNDTAQCDRIVRKIINTICVDSVPNGRFIEKLTGSITLGPEGACRQLFPPEIKMMVHLALGGAPEQHAQLDNDTLQNNALWTETDHHLHNHERSISEGMINFPLPLNGSAFCSQSESYYAPIVPQDPSTLFTSLANDVMEVAQPMSSSFPDRQAVAQQMTMWTSVPNLVVVGSNTTTTVTLSPIARTSMDVVFSRGGGSISSSLHAGNNRFRILIDLQRKPYQDAGNNIEQKERVLDDILQSVNSWKSRFWIETDIEYQWINEEQAKECLRRIFNVQTLRNKEIDFLKARKARKEGSHA